MITSVLIKRKSGGYEGSVYCDTGPFLSCQVTSPTVLGVYDEIGRYLFMYENELQQVKR